MNRTETAVLWALNELSAPTVGEVAHLVGRSRRTVQRAFRTLTAQGLLEVDYPVRCGKNEYRLTERASSVLGLPVGTMHG